MADHEGPFRVEKEGHINWLIFDRPEKRNTMNNDFFKGLAAYFQEFDRDPDTRVVIIRAEGKSFTAGIDLAEMAPMVQGGGVDFKGK